MPSQLTIVLHNPVAVYFPGQTITGHVLFHTVKPKRFGGIEVNCRGAAVVNWKEKDGVGKNRRVVHRRASQEYYNFVTNFFGVGIETELPAGAHRFEFSFVLPLHAPSSFEGTFGFVRHYCMASVKVPWGFNKTSVALFSVISILDLNVDRTLEMPFEHSDAKSVCCFCCRTGPVSYTLRLGRRGFVPGEDVDLCAEVTNLSNRDCIVMVKIFQVITYIAGNRKKLEVNEVCSTQHPVLRPGGTDVWGGSGGVIPPLPPSYMNNCSLIDIAYILEFKVNISGAIDLCMKIPITIGTIPLRNIFSRLFPGPYAEPPSAPPLPEDVAAGAPPTGYSMPTFPGLEEYPNLPPPSYEESVRGTNMEIGGAVEKGVDAADDDDTDVPFQNGSSGFAPRYVSYGTMRY